MKLSPTEYQRLARAHPDLRKVIERAAALTPDKFPWRVNQTNRTIAQQRINVRRGASQTMNSRHIPGRDGWAKAADIVPVKAGKLAWDWPMIYRQVEYIRRAAREVGVKVRWGGVWDMLLNDTKGTPEHEHALYVLRQRRRGRSAFSDGPHIELDRATYP